MTGLRLSAFALCSGLACAAVLLLVPMRMPLGANFWDLYFHLDAAYRISVGQVPHLDFFAPAGSLPFYALRAVQAVFPDAPPLLAAQYGILFPAGGLLLVVLLRLKDGLTYSALWLVVPFLFFALLPFNASSFFPAPGTDGIGLYNRQTGLMLYVFVAALFLMRSGWLQAVLLGLCLTALFLMKLNALAAAFGMLALALASGRLPWRPGVVVLGVAIAALGAIAVTTGEILPYLNNLAAMLGHNAGGLAGRILTLLSVRFDVVAPLCLLLLGLVLHAARHADRPTDMHGYRLALGTPLFEAMACFALMIGYESQNTGGQEFLPLWPVLIPLLLRTVDWPLGRWRSALLVLFAASTLPSLIHVGQAAARTVAGSFGYAIVEAQGTEAAGRYSTKPDYLRRARAMLGHYAAERAGYARLAAAGEMPETILYSTPDYQALHLLDLSGVMAALAQFEQGAKRRYDSLATLDANDLLPLLLRRDPVRGITISFDPSRGFPASQHAAYAEALKSADAILAPHCPETPARQMILAIAGPALDGRSKTALTPCWDLYLRR